MNPTEDAEDVLKTIETEVIRIANRHSEMTNYTVFSAYEAAIAHYRALDRGQQPKPANLTGLDAQVYEAVHRACEGRLGRPIAEDPNAPLLSLEDLLACLRRLKKSVEFWTNQGGRRGYLDYVSQFVS